MPSRRADAEDAGTQVAERLRAVLTIPVHSLGGADAGAVAASAGLLHVFAATRTLPINFVHPREPKPPRDPNKRMLAWAAGLPPPCCSGWRHRLGRLAAQDREIRDLQEARSQLDRDLVLLDQDDRRFKAVKDWQDSEVVWLDELYDLTAATPNIDQHAVHAHRGQPDRDCRQRGQEQQVRRAGRAQGAGDRRHQAADRRSRANSTWMASTGSRRRRRSPNTGGNRRQFLQQWSTKFDVEKRLDPADKRAASRYDRKFTATPPPRRRRSGMGFDLRHSRRAHTMTSRDNRLAIILLGVIVLSAVGFFGYQFYLKPMRAHGPGRRPAAAKCKSAKPGRRHRRQTKPALEKMQTISLPANVDLARREYGEELEKTLRAERLRGRRFSMLPKQPDTKHQPARFANKKPIYTRLLFTVKAKGDLASLVDWMDVLQAAAAAPDSQPDDLSAGRRRRRTPGAARRSRRDHDDRGAGARQGRAAEDTDAGQARRSAAGAGPAGRDSMR